MVGAVSGDDPAHVFPAGLARKLDRVLIGVGAPERKEYPPSLEAGLSEQLSGQARAWLGAPGAGHEAELLRLGSNRLDDERMLMAEVAALGEAAHVEDAASIRREQACAGTTRDGRRVPVQLNTPRVQDRVALS